MKTFVFLFLFSTSLFANEPVVVAVVDMGIAYNQVYELKPYMHEPLKNQLGWDFSEDKVSSGIDYQFKYEQEFHGTFIAYLLTRPYLKPNTNRIKVLDIVYNDYFGNLFELNRFPYPSNGYEVWQKKQSYLQLSQHLIKTFSYAERAGSRVINFSSSDRGFHSQELLEYLKEAKERGTIFVVSAGNDGMNLDNSPQFPCSYNLENVICVGATGRDGKITPYSNHGKDVDFYTLGDIATFQGTSFSAPIISRAVALIINKKTNSSPESIKKELTHYSQIKNGILVFNYKKFHNYYK